MNEPTAFVTGQLIRFVFAEGRWKGEKARSPGEPLVGKVGIIISGPVPDSHDWGDVWKVHALGRTISHWGDFMEVV